jgi:hypothetical protein
MTGSPLSLLPFLVAETLLTILFALIVQTILCTIHQPSAQILEMFDRLLLLDSNGAPVYFGEVGPKATTLISHFEARGARSCTTGENPAEWILEVTEGPPSAENEIGNESQSTTWADKWARGPENQAVRQYLVDLTPGTTTLPVTLSNDTKEYAMPFWKQLSLVSWRILQDEAHDPSYLMSKVLLCICMASLHIKVDKLHAINGRTRHS